LIGLDDDEVVAMRKSGWRKVKEKQMRTVVTEIVFSRASSYSDLVALSGRDLFQVSGKDFSSLTRSWVCTVFGGVVLM
jgi:hypothetical protein